MSDNIVLKNLDKPEVLEDVYRSSPEDFEADLENALKQKHDSETLKVWHVRLNYISPTVTQPFSVTLLVILCLITGLFTKLPSIFSIDSEWYYPRFVPLIVITAIMTTNTKVLKTIVVGVFFCVALLLLLPHGTNSDSIIMALVHLPLFAISLLALSFMSDKWNTVEARLNFITYIGEMGIYTVLILLGGIVLTGITIGLFNLIGLSIEDWYIEYVVVLGVVSSPLVATYLFDSVQNRQSKFASILSNVFTPLFLITVTAYLMATFYQGNSPYADRDFLINFNGLLVIILALTIFSISGKKQTAGIQLSDYVNVSLISVTLIVNVIALSAILFRWAEYGITVNRVVVTGANLLIFIHLVLLLIEYIKHLYQNSETRSLESTIVMYLPVYTAWSLVVSVVIPVVFQFE